MHIEVGSILYTRSLATIFHNVANKITAKVTYAASGGKKDKKSKNKVFVVLLLGVDDYTNSKLDPDEVLKALGWTPPKE